MKKFVSLLALLALTCLMAFAAVDGKWTAEVQGRGGTQTQTLTLKSSGSTITGSIEGGRGGPAEISEGKVDGDNVSFKVVRNLGDKGNITQSYTGMVKGDEMMLKMDGGRGPQDITFKRSK